MSDQITSVSLGFKVYGTDQCSYTLGASTGLDFATVVENACYQQITAFESETNAVSAAVNRRKTKVEECGYALAYINASNQFDSDATSDTKATVQNADYVKEIFNKYGLTINGSSIESCLTSDNKMTRKNLSLASTTLSSEIDLEDTELNECSTALQNIITKRDNAFSTAEAVQKKLTNTAKTLVRGVAI